MALLTTNSIVFPPERIHLAILEFVWPFVDLPFISRTRSPTRRPDFCAGDPSSIFVIIGKCMLEEESSLSLLDNDDEAMDCGDTDLFG